MLWARVPEAAVHEHDNTEARENEIGPTSSREYSSLDEEATTAAMQLTADRHLRRRVAIPDSRHPSARHRVGLHGPIVSRSRSDTVQS